MERTDRQARMGTMPVPRLLLRMGVPMMLSMLGQALYNMVDTFFVSRIPGTAAVPDMGDKAITALTLAYPIQTLIIALIVGVGIATNSLLARCLGQKDREQASRVAGNAMTVCFGFFLLIFLFGLCFARTFIHGQTQDPLVARMGTDYLRIVTLFSFGTIGYMCLEKVVMGCGNTRATMVGQLAGALTNIALDPVFIFGLWGLPAMGVTGAAAATVIGQFVSFFIIAYVDFFRTKDIDHHWRYCVPRRDTLAQLSAIGVPSIFQQLMTPVLTYGMNLVLGASALGEAGIAAYGVYYKLQYLTNMPLWGLNNASVPIISFNLGRGDKGRVARTIRCALLDVLVIMAVFTLALELFTGPIVDLFRLSDQSRRLCRAAVHVICAGYLFVGANIIMQGTCQALGNGVYPLIFSVLRYAAIVLPLAWAFSRTAAAGVLVWAAVPIAEVLSCAVAAVLTRRLYLKKTAGLGGD